MAKLITTKAERAAASYLQWDDAALGRMCKSVALKLRRQRDKDALKGKEDDDLGAVINAADGMLLVGSAVEMNAGTITLTFGGFTHKGEAAGDWELRLRQIKKSRK